MRGWVWFVQAPHSGPGASKPGKRREETEALLKNDSTQAYVTRRYDTTPENLNRWLKAAGD